MVKHVVLFYEHKVRELKALEELKRCIVQRSKGSVEVEILQYDFEWSKGVKSARMHGVDAVVVPYIYSDVPDYDAVAPFRHINEDCKVINLHHEQIASPVNEATQLPHGSLACNGCYHFVWGERYAGSLEALGIDRSLIFPVGNMRLEPVDPSQRMKNRELLSDRYGLDIQKKWVIYCEGRLESYPSEEVRVNHPFFGSLEREEYVNWCDLQTGSLSMTYEQLSMLTDSFFDECELIYRPHPGTNLSHVLRDEILTCCELPISIWISACDLVVVWNSTTALEANALSVPAVRHEPVENPKRYQTFGLSNFPFIKSLDSLSAAFIESQATLQRNQKWYLPYYGNLDGRAVERAASTIVDLLDCSTALDASSWDTRTRRAYCYRLLRNSVGNIFTKTGLVRLTHWPKEAWEHIADYPG